jgi:glycosyltransferase involved in cell wall biosynthesis
VRILYHFRTRGTGAEAVHIAGIASAFESLGHSVVFSSPADVDPRKTAGSSPFAGRVCRRLPRLAFEFLEIAYNVVAFVKNGLILMRHRPGLVYERHAFFLCSTAVLCWLSRLPMAVEVNELVGDDRVREQPLLAPLARLADRLTFAVATLVVVVSPDLRRQIVALGVEPGKVLVQPNGVRRRDVEAPTDGAPIRLRHGCTPETILVGFVGWFVPWHRLDLLLDAFASAAYGVGSLRLLLVGEGPLKGALYEQSARLGVGERVLFVGPVPHPDVARYVAAMDICTVPHSNEYRSPIKLFEYMAQGRAVVAPATEPIACVVESGEHALLFEPGNRDALAAAITNLAVDADLRRRLGCQGRALVLDRHTWERNASVVLEHIGPAAGEVSTC